MASEPLACPPGGPYRLKWVRRGAWWHGYLTVPGGRSPHRVGYYHEKRMEAVLEPYGFKRMVMSGALGGDHAGDLRRPKGAPGALEVLESKYRRGGQKTLRRWLAQSGAQGLLLPGDGRSVEALVVMPLVLLCELLAEAGYWRKGVRKVPQKPAQTWKRRSQPAGPAPASREV